MSIWTHVNGAIRFDGISGLTPVPDCGITCTFEDEQRQWDLCNVPCGTEGSLKISKWQNSNPSSLSQYTISIFGDLCDYDDDQMKDLWHLLPMTEHCYMFVNPSGIQEYQICGKKFPCTAKVGYVANTMGRFYRQYGARAQQAKNNEGIDWKAVSHALRAAFQVKQLLTEQTITFPLREAPYLTQVKRGELDYTTEVAPRLEQLMEEVEELSKQSSLPDKVEVRFWNDFIIETMERSLFS